MRGARSQKPRNCWVSDNRRGVKLELGKRLALGYELHIASSREQAIHGAAPITKRT